MIGIVFVVAIVAVPIALVALIVHLVALPEKTRIPPPEEVERGRAARARMDADQAHRVKAAALRFEYMAEPTHALRVRFCATFKAQETFLLRPELASYLAEHDAKTDKKPSADTPPPTSPYRTRPDPV